MALKLWMIFSFPPWLRDVDTVCRAVGTPVSTGPSISLKGPDSENDAKAGPEICIKAIEVGGCQSAAIAQSRNVVPWTFFLALVACRAMTLGAHGCCSPDL